jgi:DNA adenine methylase
MTIPAARPFLKWAGGKGQLLDQFDCFFPPELKAGRIRLYAEPFLGGGAVFFHLVRKYPLKRCLLSDINPEIINAYRVIRQSPQRLLEDLQKLAGAYLRLDEKGRRRFYLWCRSSFNRSRRLSLTRAAQLIFLNKTCYNGLFRMNSRGEFNAPHGRYSNPRITDPDNVRAVAQALKNARLSVMDFRKLPALLSAASGPAFVYLDPPYQPLSRTSRFTAYSAAKFGREEQERLSETFRKLDRMGARVMLSNSDPADGFIRGLYRGFRIHHVQAKRSINSRADRRGPLRELVITNY